jgi:DNA-binding SARP family transcriptional activator/predicted RNA-binding Zn ribbon-like protein
MDFQLLGPFEARSHGRRVLAGTRRQERLLLAALLLDAGRMVSVDRLADLLWDTAPPANARGTIHTYLGRLRRSLPPADLTIVTRRNGYLIEPAGHVIDALEFTDLAHQAAKELDPTTRVPMLDQALAMWSGPLLADLTNDEQRHRLGAAVIEARLNTMEQLAEDRLAMGEHDLVVEELARLAELHPTREGLAASLMIALYRCGRQADALETYHALRARLLDQLGVEPGESLRELYVRMLRKDPTLQRPAAPPYAVRVHDQWLPWKAAGHPALEFCNTYAGWGDPTGAGSDWLRTYGVLAAWAGYVDMADRATVERLTEWAAAEPAEADAVLTEARLLRSHLYACLTTRDAQRSFAVVAQYAEAAAQVSEFGRDSDGLARWRLGERAGLRLPLYAAARSAADLLADPRQFTVRRCPGHECGWLFLDQSGLRQFCSIGICGVEGNHWDTAA